jgi:hypothetical protein
MNEQPQDFELLRQFVVRGDQTAFSAILRRHLDMVSDFRICLQKERHG